MHTIKRALFALFLLFFLPSSIVASNYLKNDFRDNNTSVGFTFLFDAKSNIMPFNIFEKEWDLLPEHKSMNEAFGKIYSDLYVNFSSIRVGSFGEITANIYMNDGFIKTWQSAQKDFFTLLSAKNINESLEQMPIEGEGSAYESSGVYLQKYFELNSNNFFSIKSKLYAADKMQYIKVGGNTNAERFQGSADYYYTDENYVTKSKDVEANPISYGYGLDLEYIFDNEDLYFHLGGYNLESYIYWKGITRMHYDFDSETIYIGEDGYNHYKPFGKGFYEYDLGFKQKLPHYYASTLHLKLCDTLSVGDNLSVYTHTYFNELYVNMKLWNNHLRVGYFLENSLATFGYFRENFSVEVSNNFGPSNNIMMFNLKFAY